MIKELNNLSATETELVLKAPILVSILIAGADGKINKKEVQSAIETARKGQSKAKGGLLEFYTFVAEDFEDKLKVILQTYSSDPVIRCESIVSELGRLNGVLEKLDEPFALELYNNLKEIALRTAQSSGGLLGVHSISDEEIKYVNLPMIKMPSE
jgi:hypothetical protein